MQELNEFEKITLELIERAAERGETCPTNLDIEMELGCNSTSVAPMVVSRLEDKGYIEVKRFQRAREVTILSTGAKTARHPQRKTTRKHVPRGHGSTNGKTSKKARTMQ